MRPILFYIGDTAVPAFWTTAFLGFLVAFLVVRADVLRRGLPRDLAYDIVLYAYTGGWVGARLFLIPTAWDIFVADPIAFLLSGSGWVWYGGVIGGGLALWILSRRRGLSMLQLADITSPGLAIGLAIGRIGCHLSGDGDYGVPTDLPWGMSFPNGVVPTTERVHPAPLYEMIVCVGLFIYLWRRQRQNPPTGDLFAHYLIVSGITRLLIEFIRRNPAWIFGLTTAQVISVVLIGLGVVLLRQVSRVAPIPLPVSG